MKHIWYSLLKHTSGTFDIAKDFTMFCLRFNLKPKAFFPIDKHCYETLFFKMTVYVANMHKDFPEMFGIGSFREPTAPAQPLTLNMHKTALDDDVWP